VTRPFNWPRRRRIAEDRDALAADVEAGVDPSEHAHHIAVGRCVDRGLDRS
jgi:hypothetical protein